MGSLRTHTGTIRILGGAHTFGQDGVKWTEVYATDSNALGTSNISLGAVSAARVPVVTKEVRNCLASSEFLISIAAFW